MPSPVKTKVSPTVVGLFVLGGVIIGLVGLFAFGGVHFFAKPQRFVVFFDESISGLDLGSPVKMRGVRVGRVTSVNIRYEQSRNRSIVGVVCELSRDTLLDETGEQIDVSDREALQNLIDRGMRAQLGVIGLATGLLYVELDFYNPKEHPVPADMRELAGEKYAFVPAVPSAISEFQANLTEILNDVKRIDFAKIGSEFQGLLTDARAKLDKVEVNDLIAQWTEAGKSVNALAADPKLKEAIGNMNVAAMQLQSVLNKLDGQIVPTTEKLNVTLTQAQQTLATFDATAATLREFVASQQNFGANLGDALEQVSKAAEAVRRLADFLERNPNALLTGRKAP